MAVSAMVFMTHMKLSTCMNQRFKKIWAYKLYAKDRVKKTIVSRNGIFAFINPCVQICIIPLFRREWHFKLHRICLSPRPATRQYDEVKFNRVEIACKLLAQVVKTLGQYVFQHVGALESNIVITVQEPFCWKLRSIEQLCLSKNSSWTGWKSKM